MEKRLNRTYPNSFAYPALFVYGLFFVIPVLAAFILGFTDWNIDRIFEPKFNGLDNYKYLFENEYFWLAVKNTLIFAGLTTLGKTLLGLFLALAVNRPLVSKNYLRTLFYMPAVLSMVVVGIMFSSMLRMDGLINQILTGLGFENLALDWLGDPRTALYCTIIAEIWKWSGFTMAIFIAGLQSISSDYYEAAKIDGATPIKQFRYITLPLLTASFNIAFTMNLIGGLKVFEQVYVLTAGGPGFSSQVLGTYIFTAFSEGSFGRSTAMGLFLFIIVFSVSYSINKVLREKEVEY